MKRLKGTSSKVRRNRTINYHAKQLSGISNLFAGETLSKCHISAGFIKAAVTAYRFNSKSDKYRTKRAMVSQPRLALRRKIAPANYSYGELMISEKNSQIYLKEYAIEQPQRRENCVVGQPLRLDHCTELDDCRLQQPLWLQFRGSMTTAT